MPCYAIEGVVPVVDPSAYVHPTAVLIGDVIVGPGCYVGPTASLRGDFGRVTVGAGAGANVQDGCVLHCFPGREVVVEADGHIGHGAVLHGCRVRRGALIGILAVVMDGCDIGERSLVGAGSVVAADTVIPDEHVATGSPATVRRPMTHAEISWKANGTAVYQELARRCLATLQPAEPLTAVEDQRPTLSIGADRSVPLREFRSRAEQ